MEWLALVIVVAIIWRWIKGKNQRSAPSVEIPEMKVTVTNSMARGSRSHSEITDVGGLVGVGSTSWVLNPKSPFPLTICNADRELALKLKTLLGAVQYWTQKVPDIALLIAQHNLRFKEVDAFIVEYRPKYETEITRLTSTSSEWVDASEKDRQDIRAEFEKIALESLGVSVGHADLACLLEGELADFIEDDKLIHRFGGNSSLYSFYLSLLSRSSQVVPVKADDYLRKAWEQLVDRGFARRGKDIPTQLLLEGLRLKDINELLAGTVEKPFGRKAKAIEAVLILPDLTSRLSDRISYREMFQVIPPSDINAQDLGRSFAYATALASVVQQTFYTGVRTLEAIAEHKLESEIYDAWEITHWKNPPPSCAAPMCKMYDRLPTKLPPFHIGCSCQLECSFKE